MRGRRPWRSLSGPLALALCLLAGASVAIGSTGGTGPASRASSCRIGTIVGERRVLAPSKGTFYSVDALNPDVVARGGRYYMFFSGNDVHSIGGHWMTGLAVASRPEGPFHVRPLKGNYLNGGTVVWKRRFYQARTLNAGPPELASSADGIHWRHVAEVPQSPAGTPYVATADYALERTRAGLRLYFLARQAPFFGDIGSLDWTGGRWRKPRTLLHPGMQLWEDLDLGEPAPLRLDRHYLLYVGTALHGNARSIGLAYETARGRWRPCSTRPLIPPGAPWGASVSIDPSPLVVRRHLYVYFGGGSNTSIAADLNGAIGFRKYRLAAVRR